jgi:signal transduction histidine kinase
VLSILVLSILVSFLLESSQAMPVAMKRVLDSGDRLNGTYSGNFYAKGKSRDTLRLVSSLNDTHEGTALDRDETLRHSDRSKPDGRITSESGNLKKAHRAASAMNSVERIPGPRRVKVALLRYGLAAGLVGAALGLTLLLQGIVSTAGFIFFYTAVVISAWLGGKWAGWFASIVSIGAVAYFFMPPVYSFKINRESLPIFFEFAASSAIVSWFSSSRKHAETELGRARDELQMRVEERTAELKQTNQQLLAEMSERKRAEDAFYEAQAELARVTRISALGALAASISHEVNQPLAAVVTNADACLMWLLSDPPNLEEVRAAVENIAQEGTRASDVVRHIRAMFTKAAPERASVGINELIGEVSALLQAVAAKNNVTIKTEFADDLPSAMGDRVQLQQVIMNLIQNGIEAMQTVADRPRLLLIRSETRGPDEVLVAVKDSGSGIDPKDEKRIFDAFFTTKIQGMGMGLSISHSIIEAHGGRLWATANSDYGSTLQFTLPADREAAS